ncbi:hypothetical protein [Agromyces kandeliae]|uniref:hypothetical protein n=1 Tax=Agromyces kandeliae TaxID=2666141 RepID=UPI001E5553E6|nr:hypothetical protein [Agromyces kandeliae]
MGDASPVRSGRGTASGTFRLGRWVTGTTLGESVGFLVPVTGFAFADAAGLRGWAAWLLLVAFGAGEGALLGLGQSLALRRGPAEVSVGRWVAATAAAASAAWALGMLPSTLDDAGVGIDWARPATWVVIGFAGLVLLASIPLAQWPVLAASGVPRAWRWVPLGMVAWLVGLPFTFAPSPIVDVGTPAPVVFALFAASGVLMAVTMAFVTGLGLRRMLRG